MENGYVIPFESLPPIYEEPNNQSAVQDPVFVNKALKDLHELGIIAFTDVKPHCVSPLTVSLKTGRDGLIKKRLCWDGSRCVNKLPQETESGTLAPAEGTRNNKGPRFPNSFTT